MERKTVIVSNGSKWAGEEPANIEDLCRVLNEHPLNRLFENYGNFVFPPEPDDDHIYQHYGFVSHEGVWHFWGNFESISHVFSIYTNDLNVIERLRVGIRENRKRTDYISQDKPKRPSARHARTHRSCLEMPGTRY